MPDPVTPLNGASFEGRATVREIGPLGMITLRAKPGTPGLTKAFKALGLELPGQRAVTGSHDKGAAWMSPDEFLIFCPHAEVTANLAAIAKAFGTAHHLAVDVSDARAVFRLEGAGADEALSRLAPADLARLPAGEMRRTRLAQVASGFWREGDGFTIVTFRSVARYAFDILANSAS